ncbi:MAG: hypothetical protein AAFQ87_04120 [Bacteroidota bacterium]
MKHLIIFFIGLCFGASLWAQGDFSTCAAVYLNDNMLISEYSPRGESKVSLNAQGQLRLRKIVAPKDKWEVSGPSQEFRVAIKDKQTGSLVMLDDRRYRSLELSEILAFCEAGDKIMILATDRSLGIPGSEILVVE